jgi:hypothetical protein
MDKLDRSYVGFIEEGGNLKELVQETIDRSQYCEGFLDEFRSLLNKYNSPFETIEEEGMSIRRLKSEFLTQNLAENVA